MTEVATNTLEIGDKEDALSRLEHSFYANRATVDKYVRRYATFIKLPRQCNTRRYFTEEALKSVNGYKYKLVNRACKSGLLNGREKLDIRLPGWLFNMLPSKYRIRSLVAAAILGSGVDGREVKLGQVEIDENENGRDYKNTQIRITLNEQQQLVAFGRECGLNRTGSIIRTAIFLGFNIPNAREGVINPPWNYITAWKKNTVFNIEFLERLMILSGTMSQKLFRKRGMKILNALVYYRDIGGTEELSKQLSYILDCTHSRTVDIISGVLDKHQQSLAHAKVIYDRNMFGVSPVTKAQRQTAIAIAEGNV